MMTFRRNAALDRRHFLQRIGLAAAWTACGVPVLGQRRGQPPFVSIPSVGRNVGIRGRVHSAGKGVARVAVTDGATVVQTGADGTFTLVASARQPFVHVSLPAGYEIPLNGAGTARFYRPIVADASGEMTVEFALTRRAAPDERHAFLALPDTQTLDQEDIAHLQNETMQDIRRRAAGLAGLPMFGVSVGDIMFNDLTLYPGYEEAVQIAGIPFFQVVGNHDLDFSAPYSELTTSTFMRHFGPSYYSFNVGAVHYVVLQDVLYHGTDYVGYVDERQLRWLEADLALVEPGRLVVLFMHIPLESRQWTREGLRAASATTSVNNRAAVYALLGRFNAHVVSGHTHENEHVFEGGVHEHVHGTVCGAWWTGPICHDGSPCGYGAFDVNGESLTWIYKGTGLSDDHQLRVYAPGADPKAPDEIVANVWNWDPKWGVEWIADGVPRGPMARRVGLDPLSVQLHAGDVLPKKHSRVEPALTAHLFYAPVAPTVREVVVKATDRFGRVYSQSWRKA
jgi:hypothetical protein